jgi:hypothetical protein
MRFVEFLIVLNSLHQTISSPGVPWIALKTIKIYLLPATVTEKSFLSIEFIFLFHLHRPIFLLKYEFELYFVLSKNLYTTLPLSSEISYCLNSRPWLWQYFSFFCLRLCQVLISRMTTTTLLFLFVYDYGQYLLIHYCAFGIVLLLSMVEVNK